MIFEDSKVEDSTMMTEESDDDDDFMAKVNVYLTDRQDDDSMVASPGKALGGVLRKSSSSNTKSVKFAIEGDELRQPEVDESKTKQELLSKISRLTELLQEAESVVSLEQSKRKKKERNLVRLAKELKKRNVQQELEKERIEEVSLLPGDVFKIPVYIGKNCSLFARRSSKRRNGT